MIIRRKTRQIKVGNVKIGGDAPVSVQSMTKTDTRDVASTVKQIKRLEKAGCDIIRVAVPDIGAARAIRGIKKSINIPLVADIHFHYQLAIEAINSGADKIRLNPGNIKNRKDIEQVVKLAKKKNIPIRIGINSGSVPLPSPHPLPKGERERVRGMTKAALNYIKFFEDMDFYDIIISLKASDVITTIGACREMAGLCDYPFHLGVTAAGPYKCGIVKSSVAIGALLAEGIGDTIRVSLTGDPEEEVIAAKDILASLELKKGGIDIISCPTCGRCEVDLVKIVRSLENAVRTTQYAVRGNRGLKVAVMGCVVNGPGEAKEADIGIAAGKRSGMLIKKGKMIKKVREKDFVKVLLDEIKDFTNR